NLIMKLTKLNCLIAFFVLGLLAQAQTPEGELKRWHKVTLTFNGPNTSETASPNPFSDYNLEVTFTHQASNRSYKVPGYFAACGNAANNGCASGNKWRVHFAPDQTGAWNWSVSFKQGSNVAINGGGSGAGFMNGATGSFNVAESDKSGRDFRSKELGRLKYVGQHYLKHVGTNPANPNGPWFVKAGADSPENALNYVDFDATPSFNNNLNKIGSKTWQPHQRDYVAADASAYTWGNGKGTEMLGVINYLSGEGANVMSFLTWNTDGDGGAVFPHVLKVSEQEYGNTSRGQQWNKVHHDRFDVSKTDQWEKIMEYADKKGIYLHFKTMETENDNKMDGNNFGRERKLYYRELIARFGHHLALNWNLTEETTLTDNVAKATAAYIKNVDPYDHNIVIHTYPREQDQRYNPLLGNNSELTGASIQTGKNNVHNDVKRWLEKSRNAGKKWVVANDEQGPASTGVRVSDKEVRHRVLWGTLMAGGTGVEYYSGYTNDDGDINGNDHRKRGKKYKEGGYALKFFNDHLQSTMVDMVSADGVTSDNNDYVLAKAGNVYAVYRPNGGSTGLSLPAGNNKYDVQWYNPRAGGNLTAKTTLGGNLVAPDNNDWVALITSKDGNGNGGGCDNTKVAIASEDAYLQGTTRFNNGDLRVESGNRVSYLKFTVPSATETVTAVKLELAVSSDSGSGLIEVFKGTSNNWTEANLSNSNKPGEGAKLGSLNTSYGVSQSYQWTLSGVTPGETISLIVKQTGGNDVSFSSKEGSVAPKIILELECNDGGGDGGDGSGGDCVALEENGVVAVEAEHFVDQTKTTNREWYAFDASTTGTPTPDPDPNHASGASEGGYLEILPDTRVTHSDPLENGVSFSNTAGQVAIINYKVKFTNPGKYFVWVRAHSTGSEDNGVHVGIDGTWPASGQRMQWCSGKNQWTWESKQRTGANHCGEPEKIFINVPTAGVHTISFSMREDGFEMDKFVLSKAYTKPTGTGPAEVLVDCGGNNTAPQVNLSSPANGGTYQTGATIPLTAEASDSDGTIAKVEFFVNGNLVATENQAPYDTTTTIAAPGNYTVTAKATDNQGATATSGAVDITVEDNTPPPPPPTINIPGSFEAEGFATKSGSVRIESTPGTSGQNLGFINDGDYTEYAVNVASAGEYTFDFYGSSAGAGGTIDIVDGNSVIGSVAIPVNGQWHNYQKYSVNVSLSAGDKTLKLAYRGGAGYLFNVDKITASKIEPVEQTTTLSPVHDAYLQGASNYNEVIVRIEQNSRTGYLMFDLSSISGTVIDAKLKFTVVSDPGNGNLTIHKGASDTWTETNLSNANKPATGTLLGSLNTTFGLGNEKIIDLDPAAITGDQISLILNMTSGNDFAFGSKENKNIAQPELILTYSSSPNVAQRGIEADNSNIKTYPNPMTNMIQVSGAAEGARIKIFNSIGILQKEMVIKDGYNTIDVSDLPSGYYILNVLEQHKSNTVISTQKIIKQ
ncbi:Por secretion system C-terminal sorting domain-containing protein, partial [Aquimarina spongiae]